MESAITPKDRNTTNAGASGRECHAQVGGPAGDRLLDCGPRLLAWSLAPILAALPNASGAELLAQLPAPDPSHFTHWLVSATAALSLAALGKQFLRKTPLEAEFLTKKEFADFKNKLDQDFAAVHTKIDRCFDLLSSRLAELNQAAENRNAVLHERINEVRSLVDRVDERTKATRTGTRTP